MGFAVIMGALVILLGIIIGGVHNEKLENVDSLIVDKIEVINDK